MPKEKPATEPVEKEYTAAEIAEMHAQRIKFYKEQLPGLKLQKEYECLLADIEEARLKKITMIIRYTQLTSPEPEPEPESQKGPRKLKKDE